MRYHALGRTGLQVSEISLGTAEIGMAYGLGADARPSNAEAARLLHRALDLGINLIDTARAYGESEDIIGGAIAARRNEYILSSKVLVAPGDRVIESVHESLRRLRTGFIDIVMIHSAPVEVIREGEITGTLLNLKQDGLLRFIGASVYGNDAAQAAIESGAFDCLQVAYSALDRRPENELAGLARQNRIGLEARSVLLKGALTDRSSLLPDDLLPVREAVDRLRKLASAHECSLPELAYRYVLSTGCVQTALVGASNTSEVEQAVRFADAGPLDGTLLQHIRREPELDSYLLNPGNWPSL